LQSLFVAELDEVQTLYDCTRTIQFQISQAMEAGAINIKRRKEEEKKKL